MSSDFTVVINERQRFGDNLNIDYGLEYAPLAGLQRDYEFDCLNVDSSQIGILLFQAMGVSNGNNILEVNGQPIFGGIPMSVDQDTVLENRPPLIRYDISRAVWNANVMLIGAGVLRESNVLRIGSVKDNEGKPDAFLIDNVVVQFKTTHFPPLSRPWFWEWLKHK